MVLPLSGYTNSNLNHVFFFFLQDSLHLKLQIIVKMFFLENIQQKRCQHIRSVHLVLKWHQPNMSL